MGFRIDVPLFDGGLRKADIKETLAKKRQVDLALKDLLKQISIEIDQAYLQLMNADSVIKSLNDQLKFANENYNAVSKLFKYGLANSIDVMDANTLLVTSEKHLSDARYSYQLSILRLKRAKGVFLNSILENKIS
jgi:outer membrane protein